MFPSLEKFNSWVQMLTNCISFSLVSSGSGGSESFIRLESQISSNLTENGLCILQVCTSILNIYVVMDAYLDDSLMIYLHSSLVVPLFPLRIILLYSTPSSAQ